MNEEEVLTTRQVCQELGIHASMVRYYCNRGLVPNVRRSRTGYRIFAPWQRDWLQTMIWMRECGFTIDDLKRYIKLCRAGSSSLDERQAMLATKQAQLRREVDEIEKRADYLHRREEILRQMSEQPSTNSAQWV